jgi:hypothetical protein
VTIKFPILHTFCLASSDADNDPSEAVRSPSPVLLDPPETGSTSNVVDCNSAKDGVPTEQQRLQSYAGDAQRSLDGFDLQGPSQLRALMYHLWRLYLEVQRDERKHKCFQVLHQVVKDTKTLWIR